MVQPGRMGRILGLLAALMLAGVPVAGVAQPLLVQAVVPDAPGIVSTLHLGELMPVLRDEAVAQADEMGAEIFDAPDAAAWSDAVRRIHDPARLARLLDAAITDALPDASDPRIAAALDFYASPLGQRLLALELSARRAMAEPGGEDAARAAFDLAETQGRPRVDAIRSLIDDADLVEPNVAGALNAALAFSQGFADAGGLPGQGSQGDLLMQVAVQEPEIRSETVAWVESYLLLAYSGLSDDELAQYATFAATPGGRALGSVLFAGFDDLFTQTARDMGMAAARQLVGQSL
ncbi:MAG: DUF2059 domain-containing protein [Paracoccus sp. (in: a-proteobacteria)]|uniref:DUF2059 domain-containing protein n=1 Tax=Paracoccus sp. TaxID=267 RepID=UPI0026DEBF03|nr:DUF2059 domain-containing protein [Paracoccus sp. (in: a-proteobacteria)]MDO5614494.1 DUF2059 domain-containing protein [Paracoccus sp. (in: a-proteobacteria)]